MTVELLLVYSILKQVNPCLLFFSIAAETDAEHIRVDLAMDEAIDLKRSAAILCYNRDFVCIHLSVFYIYISFVGKNVLSQ